MRAITKRFLLRLSAPAQCRLVSAEQHPLNRMPNFAGAIQLQRTVGPQRDAHRTGACGCIVGGLPRCGVVADRDVFVTAVAIRLLPGTPATTQRSVRLMR